MCCKYRIGGGRRMSFWNSRYLKARKEHKCIYCGKSIIPGEMYHRETGTFEDEFNDYCLCEFCKPVVMKYDSGEELSSLFQYSEIKCPECGESYIKFKRLEPSVHKYKCTCYKCKHEWEHELMLKDFGVEVEE